MEKQGKIHEFNPVIYPSRLWVGIDIPPQLVKDTFFGYNLCDDTISDFMDKELLPQSDTAATTYLVCNRKDNWIGAFVNIRRKDRCSVGVMAHEASLVCDFLSERIGLMGGDNLFKNGEARAYIIEWTTNCINEVKINKVKE